MPSVYSLSTLTFEHRGGGGSGEYEAAVNSISVSVGDKRLKIFMHILHSVRSLSGQKHRIEQVEREPFTSE